MKLYVVVDLFLICAKRWRCVSTQFYSVSIEMKDKTNMISIKKQKKDI